jgi:hypothetical protein
MGLGRALILVLALVGPSQAIVIDAGSISAFRPNDFVPMFDIHGEGFSVVGADVGGNSFSSQATGLKPLNMPVDLSNTSTVLARLGTGSNRVTIQRDGQVFDSGILTGTLTFDVEPFLAQIVTSPGGNPSAVGGSTFTFAGALSFSGETAALEGAGTVSYVGTPIGNVIDPFGLNFDFAPVPEPTTLILVGTVGGLGALYRWRKRRTSAPA